MPDAQSSVEQVGHRCSSCGAENPPRSRFCASCGARLEESTSLREERKLVSILFVDLVGFTAHADGADPEDVRESLQLYHGEAKRCIEQFGGVLEKFIGDAVMAVFGAPVAHGDDAERAVRAGLRVLEAIEELNRKHDLELAARAAVNTGEAVVSVGMTPADALATGDVVNTASRLQAAAPTGRLACARAEIALHAESPESAAEWADESLKIARRTRRRKYEVRSLVLRGQALARLDRQEDAYGSLRSAIAIADELVGPPLRWGTRAALREIAQTVGDDDTAAAVYGEAGDLVESFAATLAPERAARLRTAPAVDEILSMVRPRRVA